MKKLMLMLGAFLLLSVPEMQAQEQDRTTGQHIKHGAQKAGQGVKKGAKAVKRGGSKAGHEVAEKASQGKAKITDKKVDGKQGPQGQTIYMDDDKNGYYWINESGKHIFVNEDELISK